MNIFFYLVESCIEYRRILLLQDSLSASLYYSATRQQFNNCMVIVHAMEINAVL